MAVTLAAPAGFHFDYEKVKTEHGAKDLGEVPILVCETTEAAVNTYGEGGVLNVLDGTSLRVSFQGIARRMRIAGKTDDEIAKAQLDFRPGTRTVGASTPQSRAASAAKKASEKVSGDAIADFLAQIAAGKISEEDLKSLSSS
jgi:hypothetical protein